MIVGSSGFNQIQSSVLSQAVPISMINNLNMKYRSKKYYSNNRKI